MIQGLFYNEEENIPELCSQLIEVLENLCGRERFIGNRFEIIIVDDSSTDGSKNILLSLNKKNKNVKIIFRKNKIRDLSKSCRDGFEISKFNNLIVMDGDLQHNPKYIPKMIKIYKNYNCDFVVGARDLVKNRVKSLSIFRQSASFIIIKFFEFFFGKKTIDPMSGFFLF